MGVPEAKQKDGSVKNSITSRDLEQRLQRLSNHSSLQEVILLQMTEVNEHFLLDGKWDL